MMVSLVPPPNGPEDGETDLSTGEEQLSSWLVIEGQVSGSTHLLVPPHHPQPYPVPMLTARQEVHEVTENAEQLYSVTEELKDMVYNYLILLTSFCTVIDVLGKLTNLHVPLKQFFFYALLIMILHLWEIFKKQMLAMQKKKCYNHVMTNVHILCFE